MTKKPEPHSRLRLVLVPPDLWVENYSGAYFTMACKKVIGLP
jgi:hypothetical protein